MFFLLFACATSANAEITFNSVPWLANEETVSAALTNAGMKAEMITANESAIYLVANEALAYQPTTKPAYSEVCYAKEIPFAGKVAGFPIRKLILSYAYDGTMKLIAVKVDLIGADYETLRSKLTKVYGEGETNRVDEEGIESIIWKGEKNSGILLYTESEGYDYTFIYGRCDAEALLSDCLKPDPEDISGL